MCWGANYEAQLGDGTRTPGRGPTPTAVPGLGRGVASITTGDTHACVVTTVGAARCWGATVHGQLGEGTRAASWKPPVTVSGLSSGTATIVAGERHTCAVTIAGAVRCWGSGGDWCLGGRGWTYQVPR